MTIRADADLKFIRRYLIIALGGLGFMLWGVWDGFYAYPKKHKQALTYEKLLETVKEQAETNDWKEEVVSQEIDKRWNALVAENKWSLAKPKPSKEIIGDIWFSHFVAVLGLILAVWMIVKYAKTRGSWMQADEHGISTSWGKSLDFKQMTRLNKRRWEKKGIAKIYYGEGGSQLMVLDDFKYLREPMGEIMKLVEMHLKPDQIDSGPAAKAVPEPVDKADV
jgi:hypothetical protein